MVAKQEAIGLEAITDGEFSRDWWHLDFLAQLDGVTLRERPRPEVRRHRGAAADPGGHRKAALLEADHGRRFCVPEGGDEEDREVHHSFAFDAAPARRARRHLARRPTRDMEEFWHDAANAYRAAIAAFAKAGCTYLQLDDVAFAYLCDPKIRDNCRKNGDDPDALPRIYAETINARAARTAPRA